MRWKNGFRTDGDTPLGFSYLWVVSAAAGGRCGGEALGLRRGARPGSQSQQNQSGRAHAPPLLANDRRKTA
ncbi:MAG: hypothetical protein WKG07_29455 [Hymenobacter sp.]